MNFTDDNIYTSKNKKTYAEVVTAWLQSIKYTIKETSYARYYQLVTTHIIPSLGDTCISKITTEIVEQELQRLLVSGKINATGGLSTKMVSDILSIIKRTIVYGISKGYKIPCEISKLTIRKKNKKMRVLTKNEQAQLQEILISKKVDGYKIGTLCSLYTGIRIGELCGLQWRDVDLEQGVLHITKTVQRVKDFSPDSTKKTKVLISTPKSMDSIRDIPIPSDIRALLKKYKTQPCEDDFLLTGNKKCTEPRVVQYHFKQYLLDGKISNANFHSLRHTFATRCIESGFDIKCLSEILGHSDISMTLNKYVHISFELKKENMNKLTLL